MNKLSSRILGITGAVALLAGFPGCSGGGGTPGDGGSGTGGTSGSGSGSSGNASSSTSSSGGATSGAHAFLGTWTVSGNANMTCTGSASNSGAQTGAPPASAYNVVFAAGASADLVSIDSAGCQLLWTVQGQTATLQPGQSCDVTTPNDSLHVQLDSTSTLTLTVLDANDLSGSGSLRGMATDSSGSSTCNVSGAGTLIRASH